MNESKPKQSRTYVVVAKAPPADGELRDESFTKLGAIEAGNAEDACVVALETYGMPEGTKVAVAVPVGNWNACDVKEETRPRYTAKRKSAMPEASEPTTQPTSPDPDDAT